MKATTRADEVRTALRQRYMKSAMPFLGVSAPGVKQAVRGVPRELVTALDLWDNAEFREERYAAIALLPAETDLALLRDAIEANLDDREFFVRKAIGWALRDYAWHDPDWVRGYVAELGLRLSPLSRREALKNIDRARVTP